MYKYKHAMKGVVKKAIPDKVVEKMIVRQPPANKMKRLHPKYKELYNRSIQPLKELQFKVKKFQNLHGQPIGQTQNIPFHVQRTYTGNLPVYTDYRCGRGQKLTIIRKIHGDIDKMKQDLSQVVSNAEIYQKVASLQVKGCHSQKIKYWLRGLGF